MENQYQSGSPGMHRQERESACLLAMSSNGLKGRVDQGAQRWIHQSLCNRNGLVYPILVAAFAFMPRLIHPTRLMSISDE